MVVRASYTFSESRRRLGLTQGELADVLGVSISTIQRIEQAEGEVGAELKPLYALAVEALLFRQRELLEPG